MTAIKRLDLVELISDPSKWGIVIEIDDSAEDYRAIEEGYDGPRTIDVKVQMSPERTFWASAEELRVR